MAQAGRQRQQFFGGILSDPLAAILVRGHANISFDHAVARSGDTVLPASLPLSLLRELFSDHFVEFTMIARSDDPDVDWSGNIPSCPRGKEPSS